MASTGKRNVLLVYAHHTNTSFNAALLDTAVTTLKGQGCDVIVSDLYAMKFNPVISRQDIKGKAAEPFKYTKDVALACKEGQLADDILTEHHKLQKADLVIFQFPIQWSSVPAILKGWFERVLCGNFAFQLNEFGAPLGFDYANMTGKKAVLSITMDGSAKSYSSEGRMGDIKVILYPIQLGKCYYKHASPKGLFTKQSCMFPIIQLLYSIEYTLLSQDRPHQHINMACTLQNNGFSVLSPQLHFAVNPVGESGRKQYLQDWKNRLGNIWQEIPLPCIPNSEFDDKLVLKADSKYRDYVNAPSVGTHLAKPIADC